MDELRTVLLECLISEDPIGILIFVDKSACSKKAMFQRRL